MSHQLIPGILHEASYHGQLTQIKSFSTDIKCIGNAIERSVLQASLPDDVKILQGTKRRRLDFKLSNQIFHFLDIASIIIIHIIIYIIIHIIITINIIINAYLLSKARILVYE